MSSDDFPRRMHVDRFIPAEKAIYDAMQMVDEMPADVRLTNAVILLDASLKALGGALYEQGLELRMLETKPRDTSSAAAGSPHSSAVKGRRRARD